MISSGNWLKISILFINWPGDPFAEFIKSWTSNLQLISCEGSKYSFNIDFICLPNHIKKKYADILKKYQIRIDQIFAAGYLSKNYKKGGEDLIQTAARLKYENDENEVHMIKKIPGKKGFFERFFRFFN